MTKIKHLTTIAALMVGLLSVKAQVSGTFTVGPGADYETLADAFPGLSSAGGINGNVILELQSNYVATDFTTLSSVSGYQNYSITIQPASDATDIQIDNDFRLNHFQNVVFDGANPVSGEKVVQINGTIRIYGNTNNLTLQNLKFNVQTGPFKIYGSNGSNIAPYWDDITITDCEFFAETPFDYNGNFYVIYSNPSSGAQSSWPENIVIKNNKFYNLNRTNTVGIITCIFVKSGLKAHNNSLSHEFSGYENRFNGIFSSYGGANEAFHNSISVRGGDTSTDAYVSAISFSSAQSGGKVFNNIVSITSSGSAATDKKGIQANTFHTYGYNNIYVYDDGVSDAHFYGSFDLEGSIGYSSTMTYSEPDFTDPSTGDLSLTGASLTNPDFRSSHTTTVTTDHNGDVRHSNVPSKGAFEAENMIADITSFTHANKYVDAVIDAENSTVLLEVTNGTDLSNIGPSIGTYFGASIDPVSGTLRDFTTPKDYTVTAEDGSTMDTWTASIVHQNDAPTDISLTSMDIDENSTIGSVVGTLSSEDVDGSDSHSYELVMGTGGENNGDFDISGSDLITDLVFDYETKNSYSILVRSDDNVAHGGTFEKVFTITINDLPDEAPTAIYLDNDEVVEGAPVGTVVGSLSTEDIDVADDHSYALVAGTGDSGNASFDIVDDQLVTSTSFDFADGASYSVLIRTTDNGDASFDQAFTINIKEVNDGPQGNAASSENKITPTVRYTADYFGNGLAISNGYAIAGAREHDYDENEENWMRSAGAAYVFEKDEVGDWTQTQKLVRPTNRSNYDNFGEILAMDGDYAAFGLTGAQGTATGYYDGIVLVYEKNGSGIWEYKQELTPSGSMDDGIDFGYAIGISGNYLVASAIYDSYDENNENYVSEAGAAYIFERDEEGVWQEVQKITASDRETYGYYYGESVAISGNYIAIGATEANTLAEDGLTTLEQTGAIYMYERNEAGEWNEVAKLAASDRIEYEYLGYHIDLDGETLIAGNNEKEVEGVSWAGQVYVFERSGEGVWSETSILSASTLIEDQEFGRSVAISDGIIAAGSYYVDPNNDGGGVYVFSKSGEEWIQSDIITPSSYENSSDFSYAGVSISGKDLITSDVYANLDADGLDFKTYAGAAYIFELCTNPDLPTIEASANQICDGSTVTLSVGDALLNDAISWEWYTESCGGTPVGTGASIEVSPSNTTTYYVRGEGACASSTTCSFITIEVYELCPEANIVTFSLTEQTSEAVIDTENHTVGVEVEVSTDVTSLTPSITVSPGASYAPQGAQNFTNTVVYTVTAEDGSTQDWNVSVILGENTAPVVASALDDLSLEEGFSTTQVSYDGVFDDADGHALNIAVESSNTGVVTVALASNNQLEITEVGVGVSTITVTATDGFGGSVSDEFTFSVTEDPNTAPIVATTLSNIEEEAGFSSITISYADVFEDADGDDLEISVASSNENVVTAVVATGNQIRISEVGVGSSTITLTANDGNGESVSEDFTFTVTESAPLGFDDQLALKVYPNPTTDFITIDASKSLEVQLIDLNGRTIQNASGQNIQLDLQAILSGTYLLKISDGTSSETKRIIKTN